MTSETTPIGAGELSPAPDGSALVEALRDTHRHIEELERIQAESPRCVMTHEAKERAKLLTERIIVLSPNKKQHRTGGPPMTPDNTTTPARDSGTVPALVGVDEVEECLRAALRHIYYYDGPQKNVTAWDYWKRWCKAADYDPANASNERRQEPPERKP